MIALGLDVATTGEDETVACVRIDNVVLPLYVWSQADTMTTVSRIVQLHNVFHFDQIVIDVSGVGAGVYDRARELDLPVVPFHASYRTNETDSSGQLRFLNLRAYAWWSFRERLDPRFGHNICLPEDELLLGDLVVPHYKQTSAGLIQIESKDDIRKRHGRSPDRGDAVVMCFYEGGAATFEENFTLISAPQAEELAEQVRRQRIKEEQEKVPEEVLVERALWAGMVQHERSRFHAEDTW